MHKVSVQSELVYSDKNQNNGHLKGCCVQRAFCKNRNVLYLEQDVVYMYIYTCQNPLNLKHLRSVHYDVG